jgi:hypothetical protein
MLPGKIRGEGNELPGVTRCQHPEPEQLFPIRPRWEKSRSSCRKQVFPKLQSRIPDGTITRTIYRLTPEVRAGDPEVRSRTPNIPNIFRWAGGCPTPLGNPAIPLGSRYLLLLGFVRLLWDFLLV